MFEFNRSIIQYFDSARTEPKTVGKMVSKTLYDKFNGTELHHYGKIIDTFQGIQAVRDFQNYMSQRNPINPLIHSKALDKAAQLIAEQKGREGKTQNQKPKLIYEKIQRFGNVNGKIGQLVSLAAASPQQIATYFVIDDGLASRKRRRMIMDPQYKYIGIGHAAHTQYQFITVILLVENLSENDNYYLQNQRINQQLKSAIQKQVFQQNKFQNQYQNRGSNDFY